jgi:hypothetical protein
MDRLRMKDFVLTWFHGNPGAVGRCLSIVDRPFDCHVAFRSSLALSVTYALTDFRTTHR